MIYKFYSNLFTGEWTVRENGTVLHSKDQGATLMLMSVMQIYILNPRMTTLKAMMVSIVKGKTTSKFDRDNSHRAHTKTYN